jgi:squalene-associated FAD-dependent desaturase
MKRIAVIGAGWAGLAAAVRLTEAGRHVTLYEMARTPGGRARTVEQQGRTLDNGQHILIGAYRRTLDLMRTVGVDPAVVLLRLPLALVTPDGRGLRLPPGPAVPAFARGVLGHRDWPVSARLALLARAATWGLGRFRCDPAWTVARLCRGLPERVMMELVDPLCVAALNTPAAEASASVFLRVLRDALFSGPGAADLLLPRQPLGSLLPEATITWLLGRGATVRLGSRVQTLAAEAKAWRVDGQIHDGVVLASTAVEAARLTASIAPAWSASAHGLRYEPIVTVTLECPGAHFATAMVSLPEGPAQFAFDHGAMGLAPGRFSFVISGAQAWVDRGLDAVTSAVLLQARRQFAGGTWPSEPTAVATLAERRATFRCTPALNRPAALIMPGLVAAGDHVEGPYPATLEGAVLAGERAALAVCE